MDLQTIAAVVVAAAEAGRVMAEELMESPTERQPKRQKTDSRSYRRIFRPDEALQAIKRDYLGITGDLTTPLFGAEFKLMFRVSRSRFQVLMEDIMS
jgi:hypothetical protein